MKENMLLPFVVLKHLKLSNLIIRHNVTNNDQLFKSRMSDQYRPSIYTKRIGLD